MTDIERHRPKSGDKPALGADVKYRNKGLGSQATAVVTRTVSSTVADPEQFLPPLSSDMHVDLLVHGPRGDYREFDVAPGVEKGTWQWSQIPVDLLKPEPKFKVGDYVRVVGYSNYFDGAVGTVTAVGERFVYSDLTTTSGETRRHAGFGPEYLRKVARPEPVQTRYKDGFWTTEARDIVWKIEGNKATCVQANVPPTSYFKVGRTEDASKFGSFLVPYDPPVRTVYHPREVPTPAPFKVGDRVRAVNDTYGGVKAGGSGTVTALGGKSYRYYPISVTWDGSRATFNYAAKEIEIAPAPKPAPFKHGDIIRRIVGGGPSGNSPTGTLYRIVTRGDRTYRVRLHDGFENSMPFSSHSAFELVSSDTR